MSDTHTTPAPPSTPNLNSSFTCSPRTLPSFPLFSSPLKARRYSTPPPLPPRTPPAPPAPPSALLPLPPLPPSPATPTASPSSPSLGSPSSSPDSRSLTSSAQKRRLQRKAQLGLPLHPLPPIITSPALLTPPAPTPSLPLPKSTTPAPTQPSAAVPPTSCRRFRFTAQGEVKPSGDTSPPLPHPITSLSSPSPSIPSPDDAPSRLHAAYVQELSASSLLTSQLSTAQARIASLESELSSLQSSHLLLDEVSTQQSTALSSLQSSLDAERRRYSEAAAHLTDRQLAADRLCLALEARTAELSQARDNAAALRAEVEAARAQAAATEADNARLVASVAGLQAQVAAVRATPATPVKAPATGGGGVAVAAERVRRLEGVRAQLEELRRGLRERLERVRGAWGQGGKPALEGSLQDSAREVEALLRENEETLAAVQRGGADRCPACGERCGGGGGEGELKRVNEGLRAEVERLKREAARVGEKRGREHGRHEGGKENSNASTPLQALSNRQGSSSGDKRRRSMRE